MRSKNITTILLAAVFVIGVCIMAYPSVSNYWNMYHTTRVINDYTATVEDLKEEDYEAIIAEAQAWNARLAENQRSIYLTDEEYAEYDEILNVTTTGVMGYIDIDKIDVELAVYHGTSASVLQVGAGHVDGTSLPVGGESTNCVISAHRGLPSALMFTHLDRLEQGDTFTLTILNEVYTYEVEDIFIVEPEDTENLYIVPGEDYCTLLTCTPYGINTHRLLVRGVRTETSGTHVRVINEAVKVTPVLVAAVLAVPMLAVLFAVMLVRTRRRR